MKFISLFLVKMFSYVCFLICLLAFFHIVEIFSIVDAIVFIYFTRIEGYVNYFVDNKA